MSLTSDPNDPRIKRGPPDETPVPMHDTYLVLSEEERAKGFVHPVRRSYRHVGIAGPKYPLRDLTPDEQERYGKYGYVKFEEYSKDDPLVIGHGKFWTQKELDSIDKGCGVVTTMGRALAETYARSPGFYGSTYCCGCNMHRKVGADGEFVWEGTTERVGT
jgi:hypothetical protein